jgi:hypothetical protein
VTIVTVSGVIEERNRKQPSTYTTQISVVKQAAPLRRVGVAVVCQS